MNENHDKQPKCDNKESSCKDEVIAGLFSLFAQADAEEEKRKEQEND